MVDDGGVSTMFDGATLLTVTLVLADVLPVSSSDTVTEMASTPDAEPLGELSKYRCVRLKLNTPAASVNDSGAEPSPQFTVTVCLSCVPGSLKLPSSVTV